MPRELVQAIVGGLRKVIYTRLRRGREQELLGMVGQLGEWSLGYGRRPTAAAGATAGRPGGPGEIRGGDAAERMMAAATETIAERGYPAATIGEMTSGPRPPSAPSTSTSTARRTSSWRRWRRARRRCSRRRCPPTGGEGVAGGGAGRLRGDGRLPRRPPGLRPAGDRRDLLRDDEGAGAPRPHGRGASGLPGARL